MKNKVLLIPAAGKGSRSNLDYPKSLFKIKNTPIIIRILNKFKNIKKINKCLIINKNYKKLFKYELSKYKFNTDFVFQNKPSGMGNAILSFEKSKYYKKADQVIVIWGDMPFIKLRSIKELIRIHELNNNDFTLITTKNRNPYTIVRRNKKKQVTEIIETKDTNKKIKFGEKDIGLFIFNKIKIFKLLKKKLPNMYSKRTKEHGFLYLIKHLYNLNFKVEAICIGDNKEGISFNQIIDIEKYL